MNERNVEFFLPNITRKEKRKGFWSKVIGYTF